LGRKKKSFISVGLAAKANPTFFMANRVKKYEVVQRNVKLAAYNYPEF
jgi:hypothetical protein